MDILCFMLALLLFFVGVPASIIWLIVALCSKKNKKNPLTMLVGCFVGAIVLMIASLNLTSDEGSENADSKDAVIESAGDNEEAKKEQNEKEKTEQFEYADTNIKYLKSEIDYNSIDEKCLFVYFEFTNNSDENQSFDYLVSCKAFQNGVELDTNYIYDCDEEKNGSKEIQPGASITVAEVFELSESTDNVTLEITPFSIWSDRKLFEYEVELIE